MLIEERGNGIIPFREYMSATFSFIIPVYNAEKHLNKCMLSVLGQTYKDFEVILVDDGSTDQSSKMCDGYSLLDSRVRVIHQDNGGQTVARQTASKAATGKYIVCVDSDDWIDENYLLEFKKSIDSNPVDIVCAGMKRISGEIETLCPLPQRAGYYNKERIKKELFPILIQPAQGESFSVCLWGKIIRRELYLTYQEKVDPALRMGEDLTCFLPCLYNANSLSIIKPCIYYYRDNPDSFTKKKHALRWDGPMLIMKGLSNSIEIEKYDFEEQLYRRGLRELFLVVASQFNRSERYKVIKKDILYHINEDLYREIIENARFDYVFSKANIRYLFYTFTLRYKWVFLISLYRKILYR